MNKDYYVVHIKDDEYPFDNAVLCESIGKVYTRHFGYALVFRDIIANKIIRPYYDSAFQQMLNDDLGTITYDNTDKNTYQKISTRRMLELLKRIVKNNPSEYLEGLNKLENTKLEKALVRSLNGDTCLM